MMVPPIPKTKVCTKCGELKNISEFYTHPTGADGFTARCKECLRKKVAVYAKENPEKVRASVARSRNKNPEIYRAFRKKYEHNNPEKVAASKLRYRNRDSSKEEKKKCVARWRTKNRDHFNKLSSGYSKKIVESMPDHYIAMTLKIPVGCVTPDLLEMKRAQLKVTRSIRAKQHRGANS